MKNKADISLEIMKRVMLYEKKKLRLWYEVVMFVLIAILISEILVGLSIFWEIQENSAINFMWVFSEDFETIRILSGSIVNILFDELPWIKVGILSITSFTLVACLVYTLRRSSFKKIMADQIQKFEKSQKS